MKVRFLFKSATDDATLTATSGTPSRMQTAPMSRTWQSDDLSEQTITAPFGQSEDVNLVHLENLNTDKALVVQFSDDNFATIKYAEQFIKWATDLTYASATLWISGESGGDKVLDANGDGILDINGDAILDTAYSESVPISAEYMRLVLMDSANSDGFVEIGRLMAGEYYEAANSPNISTRKSFDYIERSEQIRTRGGQFRALDRTPQRWTRVEYEVLAESDATTLDANQLANALRTVGQRKDILISVYPDEGTDRERLHTIIGAITRRSPIDGNFSAVEDGDTSLYSRLTFEVTESL